MWNSQVTSLRMWEKQGISRKFLIGNPFHDHYASSVLSSEGNADKCETLKD